VKILATTLAEKYGINLIYFLQTDTCDYIELCHFLKLSSVSSARVVSMSFFHR